MEKFLKQKAIDLDELKKQKRLEDAVDFKNQLNNSKFERNIVPDFQQKMVKDLPVDKINKLGEVVPLKNISDVLEKNAAIQASNKANKIAEGRKKALEDTVYNAGTLKQEYLDKLSAEKGKKIFGKNAPVDLDYNQLRKAKINKKLSLGGLAAGIATALGSAALPESAMASTPVQAGLKALNEGDPASLLIPENVGPGTGSLDERIEKGTLTDEDKKALRLQALGQLR